MVAAGVPALVAAAGMTWEALAGWRRAPIDAAAWTAVIPSMGYFRFTGPVARRTCLDLVFARQLNEQLLTVVLQLARV